MNRQIRHHSQSTAVAANIQRDILSLKFPEKDAATTRSTIQICSSAAMEWTSSRLELAQSTLAFLILALMESVFRSTLRGILTTFSATATQAGPESSATNQLAITWTVQATVLPTGTEMDASVTVTKASPEATAKKECVMTGPASLKARHSIFRTAVAVAPVKMDLAVTCVKSLSALQIRVKTEEAVRSRKLLTCALV